MTGESATSVSIVCPSCGEKYESPERVMDVLRNSGFCTNLTCLQDLSAEPIDAALRERHETNTRRRVNDRRAI